GAVVWPFTSLEDPERRPSVELVHDLAASAVQAVAGVDARAEPTAAEALQLLRPSAPARRRGARALAEPRHHSPASGDGVSPPTASPMTRFRPIARVMANWNASASSCAFAVSVMSDRF